jgi:hypothetical protein
MPIRKSWLSRDKIARYLNRLRQLQDEGVDVEIPEGWQEATPFLQIEIGPPWENTIFDLYGGGIAYYQFWARMMALRSNVVLSDREIRTSWNDEISFLPLDARNHVCKQGWQEFEERDVLDLASKTLRFSHRGQLVEGWVLASGITPIPTEYADFAAVPFEVVCTDQFGHESRAEGMSVVRRSQKRLGWRGTGLDGLDMTQRPMEPSVSEESRLRYLKMVAEKRRRGKPTPGGDS